MAYLLTLNLIFMFVPCKKSYDKPESESRLVVPDSLKPHGLYSLWNSPGQNTGVIPFSRGLPNPGIEPRSPTLQTDSLPAVPQGKPMTNLESVLKSRDITWSTKIYIVKATVFPMYWCES